MRTLFTIFVYLNLLLVSVDALADQLIPETYPPVPHDAAADPLEVKKNNLPLDAINRITEFNQVRSNLKSSQTFPKSQSRNIKASSKNLINPVVGQRKLTVVHTPGHEHTGGFFGPHVRGKKHLGVDLQAKPGTRIQAAQTGKVFSTGVDKRGYGLYVVIRHINTNGKTYETRYAHLSKILVQPGDIVSQSEIIGISGKTGNAKKSWVIPHLHFEYREVIDKKAVAFNPLPYMVKQVPSHLKKYFNKSGLII